MKKILLALAMVVGIGVLGGGAVQATTNMQAGTDVQLKANETVNASYYTSGETVIIEGTVQGDLYCAGQSVEVRGTIEGDVLCAGQEVRVDGTVQGDVRVAGQNIFVKGEVAKSATIIGQMITLEGKIAQDATITGQTIRTSGTIGRDLVANAQRVTLLGNVARNVTANVDTIELRDKAAVGGNLTYTSYNEVNKAEGATIAGTTERQMPSEHEEEAATPDMPFAWVVGAAMAFLFLLPIAIVWLALVPRAARRGAETMMKRVWLSIGLGLITLIVTPIIAFLIVFTVVGIPLAIILLVLWLIAIPVAFIMAAYSFGVWLANKAGWRFAGYEFVALIVALALLVFAASLPFVGWFIALVSLACGFGGMVLMAGAYIREQHQQNKKTKKS